MKTKKAFKNYIPAVVLTLLLLAIWQVASNSAAMKHIFPGPVDIVVRTWELREPLILHHLPATLVTIISGWIFSVVIGAGLAVLMNSSEHVEAMLKPVLVVTQTIPVMCISPLFVLWMGYTIGARLLAVVLSTFFAVTLNTYEGLRNTDTGKKELMKTYGASRFEIFTRLEIPSALPQFMTGLKMTIPWAVIDAAVAEWLGATEGLGYISKRMVSKMDGAAVFAPVLILCILALIGMGLIKLADRKLAYYRDEL